MNGIEGAGRALGSSSYLAALIGSMVTLVLSLALTLPAHVLRLGEKPPAADGRDYDHLALNLARGRGFANCWSDPEWRASYEHVKNKPQLSLGGPCFLTARRAPGYPAALAVVYRVWGRSFQAGRWLGAIALAMAGAMGAFLAVRVGGVAAAALFTLCFLLDDQLRSFVGVLMSEPLASLAVMGVLAAHVALLRDPKLRSGILAGASLGLLMLVRHHFSLLYVLGIFGAAVGAVRWRTLRPLGVAYGVAGLLVFAPWGLRNCLVLQAPMPLGTQGGHGLAASYAEDEVADDDGTWNSDQAARLWAKRKGKPSGYTHHDLTFEVRSSLAVEREFALVGQTAARDWLRRNWRRLPGVALIRLRAHARGYGALGLASLIVGLAALALPETRWAAALGLVIVAMTALPVALTYETTSGRYAAPVRPVAYVVGSIGLAAAASWLCRRVGLGRGALPA